MTTLLFSGLRGAFRLRGAVVLATPGFRTELSRNHVREDRLTEVDPHELRGKADPASLLGALAARSLAGPGAADEDPFSRGVFVSTRRGNQRSVRAFAAALAAGRRSPSAFSVSGYNIVAQSAARELDAKGPSVVLAGRRATLDGALFLAALRLGSGAVRTAYAGHVTWLPDASGRSGEGLAVLAEAEWLDRVATTTEQHVVRLLPSELYDRRAPHPAERPAGQLALGTEDFEAVLRVAPVLAGARASVGAVR